VTPHIREAGPPDLPFIVRLYEEDEIGGHGDAWNETNRAAYEAAFAAIRLSADNAIFVSELDGTVVGVFQLTFIPTIAGRGSLRARLGGMQVAAAMRSRGIGARMVAHAEAVARARGAASLELTSNGQRIAAHRFYERLGFKCSHQGFKKPLKR
jgi:GNAT superfamily N-acetyltransferase